MKKPLYKRELSHSYLVMEDIPEELAGHYQYRMILRNRIPGLLVSSERYMEGRACLYYDISSRQSLEQLYLSARIGMKEIRGIIDNLAQVLDSMSEYLLEERFLILEPEYIYMDLETEQLFFLYYPFLEENKMGTRYLPLAEFFLEHVDHREEMAVSAAYQFYKMSKAESFMVGSFRTFLEKGMREEKEQGEARAGAGKSEIWGVEYQNTKYQGIKYDYQGRYGTGRAVSCFYEEEGPYEYGAYSDEEWELEKREDGWQKGGEPENGRRQSGEQKNKEQKNRKRKDKDRKGKDRESRERKRSGAIALLVVTAVLFLLICIGIWYLRPEGGKKIAGFVLLAADGLFLLICLWRATAEGPDEAEEEEPEEELPESNDVFWEEYAPPGGEELEGPTVYLSRSGTESVCPDPEYRRPRLTGMPDEPDGRKTEYSLERLPVLVGKQKSRAQILLSDASVSRIHARFVEQKGKTALIDLNSTNGTFVNGLRLEQEEVAVLEDGDELCFGNVRMKYEE